MGWQQNIKSWRELQKGIVRKIELDKLEEEKKYNENGGRIKTFAMSPVKMLSFLVTIL